jgi:hypothetical protein
LFINERLFFVRVICVSIEAIQEFEFAHALFTEQHASSLEVVAEAENNFGMNTRLDGTERTKREMSKSERPADATETLVFV